MTIHKEGRTYLIVFLVVFIALNVGTYYWVHPIIFKLVLTVSVIFYGLVLQFFRNPTRKIIKDPANILAPADGKIVVVEETEEQEYFHGRRVQISIFMSPINVHCNRMPVAGKVAYFKYHPGKYLVAWHPKSSTENERTTMVIRREEKEEVLVRQIAGAVARRIKWYVKEGDVLGQGDEFGFIKFGSRVDVFLPVGTEIMVKPGEKAIAGKTVLAVFA